MWLSFIKPLLLTLLMHGIGIALLVFGLPDAEDKLLARPMPKFVNAELVVLEKPQPKPKPAPKPKPEPKPAPKPEPKPAPKPEPKPQPKPEPKKEPAPKPKVDEAKKKAEQEKAEQARRDALKEQQRRELESALSEDEELLEAQEQRQVAATYESRIARAVELAWSRPPSARDGMRVKLRIRLIPTGEVVDVKVIDSSGDAAFDRSALQAVQKVGGFPELQNVEYRVFKQYFETFVFDFRPEDLRR
ncbi:colicin import membrane protein [Litorivivens lipolytica]|uniref:Protein TonB n=1 Tax=Litorivivens lipolytica TaxID=1524264 RepID=A0A7W4Z5D3_9GAMM|nr:cell envelope integrity protein TolA [Litorivivens lipolytica]MBB3047374.1 colicin import membrane protein [Litorivivens lipolytica]